MQREVGIDQQQAIRVAHEIGALCAELFRQARAAVSDFLFGLLAENRVPVSDGPGSVQRWENVDAVTVPQRQSAALRARKLSRRRNRRIARAQALGVLEKGGVERPHVVAVQTVKRKHFPVCPDAILLRARNHAPTLLRLVENEIDVILGVAEISDKVLDSRMKAYEIKPAIVVDSRRRDKPHRLLAKTRAVTRLIRHTDQIAMVVERPRVIEALEKLGVALVEAADIGAPVGAAIVKHPHAPVAAAHPKERLAGHRSTAEVARVGNLGVVTDIEPAALENVGLLQRRDFRRTKYRSVHPEDAARAILVNQVL